MQVALVKCGGANFGSVQYALERLGVNPVTTDDATVIRQADKVILPGVGSAQAAMQRIAQHDLAETLKNLQQPTLAICLGMQILCEASEEGDTSCLGIIPVPVQAMQAQAGLRIPHMGWNQVSYQTAHPLFKQIPENDYAYFVHAYAVPVSPYTIATSTHGERFSAALAYKNFYAVQYHPERSGKHGQQLLKNFIEMQA
ncbi:MAG: imidazole glycerol phosphate synthase subunit HisH [Gammaproteobacteria bacterium]|nr:imidazole glycerol phosphate synthase subunit HisH [Gammaproteobacteria bacterium]NNC97207.1 imidazole glycerol phosphate synthase subunit HisH [Gammaproteobacteria bacterium]NNM14483.1 imidazole glycerol phosphate synthase subunit HisH [Gammaproteobacteria bacterium]